LLALLGSENATAIDLGGGLQANAGGSDIFVAKYSGLDGSYRWSKTVGSGAWDYGNGVATDPNTGNVIITGTLGGPANFGGGLTPSAAFFWLLTARGQLLVGQNL